MKQHLGSVTFLVRDYDEAIAYFTGKLGFTVGEDTAVGGGKRWVRISPRGPAGTSLLLAEATTPAQHATVGAQAGDRVFLFLQTDDFARDHRAMVAAGVDFAEEPRYERYGTVAIFRDLYGNKWDLLELRGPP